MFAQKPNILVVLTDDQGPWATPWSMPEIHMPELENLATQPGSYRIDQFYCASPVCSPARASILTGKMPSAHGVHDWITGTRHPQAYPDKYIEEEKILPLVLAEAGYRCAMVGKWHVGESWPPAPGFEFWFAHRYGGGNYYQAPIWDEQGQPAEEPQYFTEALAEKACEFLDTCDDSKPFFMWLATTAPHDPWLDNNHPSELLAHYDNTDFPSVPREKPHPWTQPRAHDFDYAFADPVPAIRGYCASLTGVDNLLAKLRNKIADKNLADNTIIVYMADNGFSCGHHGVWGKGNGTYPINFWENSVRVPAIIHIPVGIQKQYAQMFNENAILEDNTGETKATSIFDSRNSNAKGVVVNAAISAVDFYPTICDLAQVTPCPDNLRAGESFLPLLFSPVAIEEDSLRPVLIFEEYGGGRMIRRGDWKLITRFEGPDELYNLADDPQESHNLISEIDNRADIKQIVDDIQREITSWFTAHETRENRAYERPVRGFGQIHPLWRIAKEYAAHPNLEDPYLHAYVQGDDSGKK